MLRNGIIIVFIFVTFILQTTFHEAISIGSVAPNLVLASVCCMGFIRGRKFGMLIGFVTGLLLDVFFGYAGVIGFTAISYMYLGYINGLFHEIFYTDDICIPMILTMMSNLIYNFLFYCVTFLLRGQLDIMLYFENIIFPEMIYTGCITVFLFRLLKVVDTKLEKYEKRGEEKLVKRNLGDID